MLYNPLFHFGSMNISLVPVLKISRLLTTEDGDIENAAPIKAYSRASL